MTVQKVAKGQPFRPMAEDWNAFADAANEHGMQSAPVANPGASPFANPGGMVWVRNDTGAALACYMPVKLGEMITAPSGTGYSWSPAIADNVCFSAGMYGTGNTAVPQQPLAAGGVGRAVVSGATPVYISLSDHPSWQYATFSDGHLQQRPSGEARILWLDPRRSSLGANVMAVVALGAGSNVEPMVDAVFNGSTLQITVPNSVKRTFAVSSGATTAIYAYRRNDVYNGRQALAYLDPARVSGSDIGAVSAIGLCQLVSGSSVFRARDNTFIDWALTLSPLSSTVVTWLARQSAMPTIPPSALQWNPYTHTVSWYGGSGSIYVPPDTLHTFGVGGTWGATPRISEDQSYLQSLDWYYWSVGSVQTDLDGALSYFEHNDLPPGYAMVRNQPGT